jgi:hypothetical protein
MMVLALFEPLSLLRPITMSDGIFLIPSLQFSVFQGVDGSLHWQGDYQGMEVVAVVPADSNSTCIILLEPTASKQPTFQNLLRVDHGGNIVWKAELPGSHDVFADVQMKADGLYAHSMSGYLLKLDPSTGRILERTFVK